MKNHKFGDCRRCSSGRIMSRQTPLKNIDVVGVDCHIGSQLTAVDPFVDALKRLRLLIDVLKDKGISIRYLDLGGGLGIVVQPGSTASTG